MKIRIAGNMDKEDLIAIGKFIKERFGYPEKKVVHMFVDEGTEDMSLEEVMKLLNDIMK